METLTWTEESDLLLLCFEDVFILLGRELAIDTYMAMELAVYLELAALGVPNLIILYISSQY